VGKFAEVRLTEIRKAWGADHPAVDAVSFTAEASHLAVLLGPSGCGKSTTLRIIAGLETPDSGTVTIAGRDVTWLAPSRRGVAMVFQSYALFPHLTVAENVLFGLKVRKVPRAERDARLKRASGILGLEKLLERKPAQLSGGQQQRVALGRAIVSETPVCLMDEPLSNLDAQLRGDMRREIRALQRRLGITMIYVTHDQVEAMTLADQVIVMRAGRVEQTAPPAELYARPATMFAARFIGTPPMNVIPARALANEPEQLASAVPNLGPLDGIALGVRPEAVQIRTEGVPARVVAVEYLGADTLVETRIEDEPFMVRVAGGFQAAPGDILHLGWDAGAAHWFDLSSGRRIESPG
jgi:sn-glycerol 3-phosphate transport system ATP-binding protein